jgi:thiol:disulfide interchange protein DsbC
MTGLSMRNSQTRLQVWLPQLAYALLLSATLTLSVQAADEPAPVTDEELNQAVAQLLAIRPDIPIDAVYPTQVDGLFGADLPDGTTLYITADGKHMIVGDMYAIGSDLTNVSDQRRAVARRALMDQVALSDMVIFPAKGERQAVINIFTDVDCGYCRKLHSEIDQYAALGIEVRYLAYPREGLESDTASTMRSVWCATDPATAMTRAKNSQRIADRVCPTDPVDAQFELGRRMGVSGTPALVTESGEMFPGYIPAPQLAQRLGISLQQ